MSIKKLGQQSLIYGTGNLAAKGVTFMLLPLYTNVFSPEDYGIVSLVFTFLGFMNVVLHYGLDASLLKHNFTHPRKMMIVRRVDREICN